MKTFLQGSIVAVLVLATTACVTASEPASYEEWALAGELYSSESPPPPEKDYLAMIQESSNREVCPRYDPTLPRYVYPNIAACWIPEAYRDIPTDE